MDCFVANAPRNDGRSDIPSFDVGLELLDNRFDIRLQRVERQRSAERVERAFVEPCFS